MSSFERYLTPEEQHEIKQAFIDAGFEYDKATRRSLTDGIDRTFIANSLPNVGSGYAQLGSDLIKLSTTKRLIDNSVPLERWLRNAIELFAVLEELKIFKKALDKVIKIINGVEDSVPAEKPTDIVLDVEDVDIVEDLELIIDELDNFHDVSFLENGAKYLSSVVKLLVPRFEDGNDKGRASWGTGWLITKDLIVTNYHVVNNRDQNEPQPHASEKDLILQTENTNAQFNYNSERDVGEKIGIKQLIAFGKETTEDFALLRLDQKVEEKVPYLRVLNEKVQLSEVKQTKTGNAVKVLAVNIIQHPKGEYKRVALRHNHIYKADYPTLLYYADTLGGSSGSPVCDDNWRVIGLHRAGLREKTQYNGKVFAYVNQGIQIHSILANLEEQAQTNPEIKQALEEIKEAQNLKEI